MAPEASADPGAPTPGAPTGAVAVLGGSRYFRYGRDAAAGPGSHGVSWELMDLRTDSMRPDQARQTAKLYRYGADGEIARNATVCVRDMAGPVFYSGAIPTRRGRREREATRRRPEHGPRQQRGHHVGCRRRGRYG